MRWVRSNSERLQNHNFSSQIWCLIPLIWNWFISTLEVIFGLFTTVVQLQRVVIIILTIMTIHLTWSWSIWEKSLFPWMCFLKRTKSNSWRTWISTTCLSMLNLLNRWWWQRENRSIKHGRWRSIYYMWMVSSVPSFISIYFRTSSTTPFLLFSPLPTILLIRSILQYASISSWNILIYWSDI